MRSTEWMWFSTAGFKQNVSTVYISVENNFHSLHWLRINWNPTFLACFYCFMRKYKHKHLCNSCVHAGDKFIESLCLNLFCIIHVIYVYYDYCIQSLVATFYSLWTSVFYLRLALVMEISRSFAHVTYHVSFILAN